MLTQGLTVAKIGEKILPLVLKYLTNLKENSSSDFSKGPLKTSRMTLKSLITGRSKGAKVSILGRYIIL